MKTKSVLAVAALVAQVAVAQVAGFEVERLDLNPGASASLVTNTGDLMPKGTWRASLLAHYEHDPLILFRQDNGQRLGSIIGSRFTAHLVGAWTPLDWLEVGLQLPIVLAQGGDDLTAFNVAAPATPALGTTWLSGRFGILRERAGAPLDLAIQLGLGLPLGSAAAFTNVTPLAFAPRVGAGKSLLGWLRLGGELGVMLRGAPAGTGAVTQTGAASAFTGAISATTTRPGLRGEITLRGSVALDSGAAGGELLFGARYPLGKWVEVYAFGGPGLGALPGNPAFRVLGGLSVQPPLEEQRKAEPLCDASVSEEALRSTCGDLDADGDGILNRDDVCPRLKGVAAAKGCPLADQDGDGVLDDVDACPAVPGPKDRKGCPVKDQDKDGVEDDVDACPTVPGPKDRKGCPMKDQDNDGVEDALDACPIEPGPAERKGCPVKDTDQDGVEDSVDACPIEAGPAERKGCPLKDQDGDGVEDALDNCPALAGPADNAGCPAKKRQLVVITADKLVIKESVYFATGKAVVLPRSFKLLDNVAEVLNDHPEVALVRIEGHTDSVGNREKNVTLSQARADAVKAQLVKRKVAAERLKPVGFGPDQPAADNGTAAGREQNRRVEFNFEAAVKQP